MALALPAAAQSDLDVTLSRLINSGDIPQAQAVLDAAEPTQLQRRFFEARVLKARGELRAAVAALREIVASDPTYLNPRRELAHTLLTLRDYPGAARAFRALLRVDQTPQMRTGYRAFLAEIEAKRPLSLRLGLSVLPSTNVNRGASTDRFNGSGSVTIAPTSLAQSGVGLGTQVAATYRPLVTPDTRLSFSGALALRRYDNARFDATDLRVSARYEHVSNDTLWSLSPYIADNRRADGGSYVARGIGLGLAQSITPQTRGSAGLTVESRDYATETGLNGALVSAQLGVTHDLRPDMRLGAQLELSNSTPALDFQSYVSHGALVTVERRWPMGVATQLGLRVGTRDFRADFPLTSAPRADRFSTVIVGLRHRDLDVFGMIPAITCSHEVNRSTVTQFDYETTDCALSLGYSF
ncbi:MAG: surface lipoprotein assembly modifier [Pseudomonadota bacterium]